MKPNQVLAIYFTLFLFMVTTALTCLISILAYPEPYLFWEYHISDLGAMLTPTLTPNPNAWIFWVGMGINVVIGLGSAIYLKPIGFKVLSAIIGISFIFVALPTDIYVDLHRIGSVIMFFGIWIYMVLTFLIIVRPMYHIYLSLIVSSINFIYLLHSFHVIMGNNPMWQKISFLTMFGIALISFVFIGQKEYYNPLIEVSLQDTRCYFKCK